MRKLVIHTGSWTRKVSRLACLASSCSAISATAVQPSSAAHCGIGRRDRRETLRASTQFAYTRAHCLLDCCHWVESHCTAAPDSSAAAPRVPKNKNSEVARRHPDGLGTEHTLSPSQGVSLC